MLRFLTGRLLGTIPVLFVVSLAVFLILHLSPGDPVQIMLGEDATPQARAALTHELGLDKPLPVQYLAWLWALLHGNMGRSIQTHQPVAEEIASRLPVTVELSLLALLLALAVGLPAGITAAVKHNSLADLLSTAGALLGLSLPAFFVGILLILVFSVQLG
ncbi:MAG: ABC transporter permease, partial [Chloroflexota bacterium]